MRNQPLSHTDPTGLISTAEAWEALWNPADAVRGKKASEVATKLAEDVAKYANLDGAHNGAHDAIRHAIWNALMAQQMGADDAKSFADAHEVGSPKHESKMDQWNNAVGRSIGAANPKACPEQIAFYIYQAYLNGELRVLRNTGNGPVPSISPLLPSNNGKPTLPPIDPGVPYNTAPGNPYPESSQGLYPGSPYPPQPTPPGAAPYPGSPYSREPSPTGTYVYPGSPYRRNN